MNQIILVSLSLSLSVYLIDCNNGTIDLKFSKNRPFHIVSKIVFYTNRLGDMQKVSMTFIHLTNGSELENFTS